MSLWLFVAQVELSLGSRFAYILNAYVSNVERKKAVKGSIVSGIRNFHVV